MLPDDCALVVSDGRQIIVDASGDPTSKSPYTGVYSGDHRLLSGIDVCIRDTEATEATDHWTVLGRELGDRQLITTLASAAGGAGRGDQRTWLAAKSYRIVDNGFALSVTLRNNTPSERTVTITTTLSPDFKHVFEIPAFFSPRDRPERPQSVDIRDDGFEFVADCPDGRRRSVTAVPDASSSVTPVSDSDAVTVEMALTVPPADEQRVELRLEHEDTDATAPQIHINSSERYAGLADAAARTLVGLTLPSGVPAAGAPRFLAAFGRDSIIVSYQLLEDDPSVAKRTLNFLADQQGTERDHDTLEEPGRIMHEYRLGDLPATGRSVRTPYYGTVDATPLFVSLYADTITRTGDQELAAELYSNAIAATEHLLDELDSSGLLFYEPHDHPLGLAHLGWKDSAEALARPDGTPASGAIALAEAQGYAHRALRSLAPLARKNNDANIADTCERRADDIAQVFEDRFWLPEEECYALGVDADGIINSVASNQAHAFWGGLGDEGRVAAAVERLLEPDMLTEAGLRTFAESHAAFDPLSYHRGSVWPHDTSLAAMGFNKRGYTGAATTLAERALDALDRNRCTGAPDRYAFPELLVGTDGPDGSVGSAGSLRHPDACEPAAWSAGSVFAFRRFL